MKDIHRVKPCYPLLGVTEKKIIQGFKRVEKTAFLYMYIQLNTLIMKHQGRAILLHFKLNLLYP